MDLSEQILHAESGAEARRLADHIASDPERFEVLMQNLLHGEWRLSQRASWIVGMCADADRQLVAPYLEAMLRRLDAPHHEAVRRNVIRIFQDIDPPESLLGELVDRCFRYLADPQQPAAVRVFAISVLYRASLREPDLQNELRLLIESHLPHASAGFRSRGKKILARMDKSYSKK